MLPIAVNKCPHCLKSMTGARRALYASLRASQKVMSQKQKVSDGPPPPTERFDLVGPPNPDSNIRKVVYSKPTNRDEEYLNLERSETHIWNDKFWKQHNQRFFKEKREFIDRANAASGSSQEVADKLSVFYKEFLEQNHDSYMTYNREWYKRNFTLLWMSIRTTTLKLLQRGNT